MGEQLTIVMISMHTSPLAQPGQGDAGGLNVYVRNLTESLIRSGHQVLSFTRRTTGTEETVVLDEDTGSRMIPLTVGRLSLPKDALPELTAEFSDQLASAVEAYANYHVVLHSHYWLSGMVAHQAGLRLQAPFIHTMHTLGATKNSSAAASEPHQRIDREAFICGRAQVVTANTLLEKHELVQHTGVDASRVEIVQPGVDHDVFQPYGPAEWPGRDAGGAPRILFAGRLQRYKGPHVLLHALATLRDRGIETLPVVHFTGAVSGSSDYDLQAQAHLLGVSERVSFSAPVSPQRLATYMRAADVVAMPSVSESFGLVAVEAQACGTGVLAHQVGGLTVAISDGVTGELVESLDAGAWADALETVVQHPQRWKGYGVAGSDQSAVFSWSAMADRMVDIYCSAMSVSP